MIDTLPKIFRDKIMPEPNSGCWLWLGSLVAEGYAFGWDPARKKNVRVARYIYQHVNGPIPEGKIVCHTCDMPACVNPDHLFIGTHKDNIQDMIRKKRDKRFPGEKNPMAKLSESKVVEIFNEPGPLRTIADKFGVHLQHVYRIKSGQRWRHLNLGA